MKKLLVLPFLFLALTVSARSGKVPSYRSFVYWIQGPDTVYTENNTLLQESFSPDGTVAIRVRHEDWKNTVTAKSIARLAPWHAVVAQRRGIRAIVPQGQSNTDAMMPMKMIPGMMPNALSVRNLSNMTDQLDMCYVSEVMVENTGDQEIVINDLNRGLVWYVPANSYLLLNFGKLPQACLLRIANTDPLHPAIKYATVGTASFSIKLTIAYEDEDCWIFLIDEEESFDDDDDRKFNFTRLMGSSDSVYRIRYIKRDKDTFQETPMLEEEVFAIIKAAKESKK